MEVEQPPVEAAPEEKTLAPEVPPNQTLYIRNINEKVKVEELKKSLRAIFSEHGEIKDIVAMKTVKMKGQAFIVYSDVKSATAALKELNGFPLYDHPIEIHYAKGKSFAIGKEDGTIEELKRKRDEEKAKKVEQPKKKAPERKKPKLETPSVNRVVEETILAPNKILFVQNLPPETNEEMLTVLFSQYSGFQEVRLVPGRSDIAFVEYDTEVQSAIAKENLEGFRVDPTHPIKITFAKR